MVSLPSRISRSYRSSFSCRVIKTLSPPLVDGKANSNVGGINACVYSGMWFASKVQTSCHPKQKAKKKAPRPGWARGSRERGAFPPRLESRPAAANRADLGAESRVVRERFEVFQGLGNPVLFPFRHDLLSVLIVFRPTE